MSQNNTPSSPAGLNSNNSAIPAEPRHPVLAACGRVFDAFKGGNNCEVLQAFDELQAMHLEGVSSEFHGELLTAWGRGITTAAQMCSDDEEHLMEMVEEYEGRFGGTSVYLRVLLVNGEGPMDCLRSFIGANPPPSRCEGDRAPYHLHRQLVNAACGGPSPATSSDDGDVAPAHIPSLVQERPTLSPHDKYIVEAVDGITEKFRNFTCEDARAIVSWLESFEIAADILPVKLVEKLQRPYVARMKSKKEDVEVVFDDMISAGLKPVNAIPFTFIFMKQQPTRSLMEYYYFLMLRCGVKAVDSVYRLLVRNPSLSRDELSFVKRRIAGSSEMDDWYDKKLCVLRSIENDQVYQDATRLFQYMLMDGIVPDKHAFNKMISLSGKVDPAMAEAWFRKMLDLGVTPNSLTFAYLTNVWKHSKLADSVERWISEANARGMQLETATYVSLLESYIKSNNRNRAQSCFKALLARRDCTIHVYNIVMSLGPFDSAFGCLAAMLSDGLEPTTTTKEILISQAKDDVANGIVDTINACGWSRTAILSNPALVSPARGTVPSLADCMRLMMREMKMTDEQIKQRSEMLIAEIDLVKRQ